MTSSPGQKPPLTEVAIVKCPDYNRPAVQQSIERIFELLGGIEKYIHPQDTVLIKPNLIVPRPPSWAAQTDPAVILAVAEIIRQTGAKCFVADSPAWGTAEKCIDRLGLTDKLRRIGVPVKTLSHSVQRQIAGKNIPISTTVLEADKIINLPKLKAHQQLGATFAVKNMFGIVTGKQKALQHFRRGKDCENFCTMLIELYKTASPVLNIIDGVTAMEAQGPINGHPRNLGVIVAGADPIACELVCARIINLEHESLPIIQTAKKLGFGCCDLEKIRLTGEPLSNVLCPDFVHANPTPLAFTFPRVCKSIARQLLILAGISDRN